MIYARARVDYVVFALIVLLSTVTATPAIADPGVPPDITGISEGDQTIDPGESRFYKVQVTGYDDGGTWTFSGDGLTAEVIRSGSSQVRLLVAATATAAGGFRSLTATNPDGFSGTFADAIFVTGDLGPPDVGIVTGHVFDDLDGNGAEDGSDTGLAGVSISITDNVGGTFSATTDGSGNFAVTDVAAGNATVTYTTPPGRALTTGNDVQTVAVVADTTVATVPVGYQTLLSGDVSGHVFEDIDGNGTEDGADPGLSGVTVTITDGDAFVHVAVTDGAGDFLVADVAVGTADVVYTTPANATLTSGNDVQAVTISNDAVAGAAAVGYQLAAGTPPDITGISEPDQTIDPGETRFYRIAGADFADGATWTFSGSGLSATVVKLTSTKVRLSLTATAAAEAGLRDLTVTNPGGLQDTFVGAVTVTGSNPPPDGGAVTGHVFVDNDGNGVADGADTGLGGVAVVFVDADAQTIGASTSSTGDFSLNAASGVGTLTIATPAGYNLSTGNGVQSITVVQLGTTAAAPVGYEPGSVTFIDVSAVAGLDTSHTAAACGPPIGVGAAWADIDNDGDQDLYLTNQVGANRLYRNDGDVTGDGVTDFTDIAAAMGLQNSGINSFATVLVDMDNDGDQDLFVADETGNKVFQNQLIETGSLGFIDISATAGLSDNGRVETAAFGDFDNDGFLDLYLAKHMTCSGVGDNVDHLYHNDGDGTFSDWTTYLCGGGAVPCDDVNNLGFAPVFFDYDNDGDQDIYVVSDNIAGSWQPNKMFRNDGSDGLGGWLFAEVGAATGTGFSVNGMGLGLGDYDNNGFIDIAFSDAAPGHLLSGNGDGTWSDVSITSAVNAATSADVGWGTVFIDYDNDGWQDLFFAVGSIGTAAPLGNSMLHNNGDGTFTNVSALTGMDNEERGRATAIADFDGDGWVDMYLGNFDADGLLVRNRSADLGATNNFLTITVEGTTSNRDGIGTEIILTNEHGTQRQIITSGSNHGGGSQKAAFFGLGATNGGTLTIEWPNGVIETRQVSANQVLHFVEPAA